MDDGESTDPSEPSTPSGPANIDIADKLQAKAEAMQKDIDYKLNPGVSKQNPTSKRLRVAQGMREDARKIQALQSILLGLASAHRSGDIDKYPLLRKIRTVGDAKLLTLKVDMPDAEFDSREDSLYRLGIGNDEEWTLAGRQVMQLSNSIQQVLVIRKNANEDAIKKLEATLPDKGIPGFFPTPPELIERMLDLSDLTEEDDILEPSAGKGDLLDAIRKRLPNNVLHALEINSTLREILVLKEYNLVGHDFLDFKTGERYDKIIMNPPFEKGQDIDHVMRAYSMLRAGGKLIAIVSEGPFFRKFSKDTQFREFLNSKQAYISEPIDEGFKKSFNSTGVRVRIVAINGDGTRVAPSLARSQKVTHDHDEILDLEAQAEIELIKLRIRNQKGVGSFNDNQGEIFYEEQVDILNFK